MTHTKTMWSLLTVKSVDEEHRVIQGIASTPSTDRTGDIVEPLGAKFSLPLPLLSQHNSTKPIGEVIYAKPTKHGIPFMARVAKIGEPGLLKDRIDQAWQEIKYGLVKGVSIGFRAIKSEPIGGDAVYGPTRYLEWAWLELSCVTIPANMEATITSIKVASTPKITAADRKPVYLKPPRGPVYLDRAADPKDANRKSEVVYLDKGVVYL